MEPRNSDLNLRGVFRRARNIDLGSSLISRPRDSVRQLLRGLFAGLVPVGPEPNPAFQQGQQHQHLELPFGSQVGLHSDGVDGLGH